MKNCIIVFILFFQASIITIGQQNPALPLNKTEADANADAMLDICARSGEMAGVVAGFYQEGEVLWQGSAGYANMEDKRKADKNMLHRIASISKPMTAIAIIQLYEQGKIGLDDPVTKYLPYFPIHKKGIITIRHLLNHSSGIKAYKNSKEGFPTTNYPTLKEAIEVFQDRKLAHVPGTAYKYTTYGYVVLGAVIEKASGMSYRAYTKKYVWTPAEMHQTDVEIFGEEYPNKADLYKLNEDWTITPDLKTNLSVKAPGGGIQSTVEDLLNFGKAILEHKLIKESSFELMAVSYTHLTLPTTPYV